MVKWRPTELNCLYVIPDIHGAMDVLQNIGDRILPLRKSDGGKDRIVFLGDYIDRHQDSHLVLDYLIELEKKQGAQATFLMGNHELMLLHSLNLVPGKNYSDQSRAAQYKMWVNNGGYDTILGYMRRAGIDPDKTWGSLPISRVKDLIPKEHIEFLQRLKYYHETESYIFVHGGCDPTEPLSIQDTEELVWDRNLLKYVLNACNTKAAIPWEKTVICGHSVMGDKKPIIYDKYMMLDCGSPKQLLVVELGSKEAFFSHYDKKRLVRYELTPTTKSPGLIRRSPG